ncbi:MAG: AAA family ATPase [Dehalococcoidia bacterium]
MKIATSGKGGVGKTTLASLMAMAYADAGYNVIAIDANPDANLALALGISPEEADSITPIIELQDLIYERTGAQPGTIGGSFKLNPEVSDIPDRFSIQRNGIKLLVMGTVKGPLAGCVCPESAVLKALLMHLVLRRDEVVILDMDAGVEHLGRGTAQGVDAFLIVVEPGQRSLQTARSVKKLAEGLNIHHCYAVGCKTRNESERQFIKDNLPGFPILGFLDYNEDIIKADAEGLNVYERVPQAVTSIQEIKQEMERLLSQK